MAVHVQDWSAFPEHILVEIFHNLSLAERAKCALVCKSWYDAFECQYLWHNIEINFYRETDEKYLKCLEKHAAHIKTLHINLDQKQEVNRNNACQLITGVALTNQRRLQKIKIEFRGQNPLFYAGKEFVDALTTLFKAPEVGVEHLQQLVKVDLGRVPVMFDNELLDCLSENNPKLETVNIQNRLFVCKIHPSSIENLIDRCPLLRELCIHKSSLNEDVLEKIANSDSTSLRLLSLYCLRKEKFIEDISGEVWTKVFQKKPLLRVGFWFDHSCPLHKIGEILLPEIKVSKIRFETYSHLTDELKQVARFYGDTLEWLVVDAPEMKTAQEFNRALVELATNCRNLKALRIFCKLEQETIDKIYDLHPHLKNNPDCTLKITQEPQVFIVGRSGYELGRALAPSPSAPN